VTRIGAKTPKNCRNESHGNSRSAGYSMRIRKMTND
jgi:hypothetical protein